MPFNTPANHIHVSVAWEDKKLDEKFVILLHRVVVFIYEPLPESSNFVKYRNKCNKQPS